MWKQIVDLCCFPTDGVPVSAQGDGNAVRYTLRPFTEEARGSHTGLRQLEREHNVGGGIQNHLAKPFYGFITLSFIYDGKVE